MSATVTPAPISKIDEVPEVARVIVPPPAPPRFKVPVPPPLKLKVRFWLVDVGEMVIPPGPSMVVFEPPPIDTIVKLVPLGEVMVRGFDEVPADKLFPPALSKFNCGVVILNKELVLTVVPVLIARTEPEPDVPSVTAVPVLEPGFKFKVVEPAPFTEKVRF